MKPSKYISRMLENGGNDCTKFSLGAALFYWLYQNHEGQNSEKYAVACSIDYNPGLAEKELSEENADFWDIEDFDALDIYRNLSENNWKEFVEEFNKINFD